MIENSKGKIEIECGINFNIPEHIARKCLKVVEEYLQDNPDKCVEFNITDRYVVGYFRDRENIKKKDGHGGIELCYTEDAIEIRKD